MIPHEVVGATVDGATPLRAWREHLQLTQGEVALRLGISVAAYTMYEACDTPDTAILQNFASVLGLKIEQLDF